MVMLHCVTLLLAIEFLTVCRISVFADADGRC